MDALAQFRAENRNPNKHGAPMDSVLFNATIEIVKAKGSARYAHRMRQASEMLKYKYPMISKACLIASREASQ